MLCEYCGRVKDTYRCTCNTDGEPKAYLIITNLMADMIGMSIDRGDLAYNVLTALTTRYRCPACFTELPSIRVGSPAGDMENAQGPCPQCTKKKKPDVITDATRPIN